MHRDKKCIFVTGGGTGGHIYPAVAVANVLKEKGFKVFYAGSPKNPEKEIAQKEGFKFLEVEVSGMPRHAGFDVIVWGAKLFYAALKAVSYLLKYRPALVFGTGGYVSAPAIYASILTGTPFAIHDCDAMPGVVSKTAAPFARFVSTAFECSKDFLKSKNVICFGNPVRKDFSYYTKKSAREKLNLEDKTTILVTGGSQGARTINRALVFVLEDLLKNYDVQILHQTGKKNYDETIDSLKKIYPDFINNKNYIVKPYFDEMFVALKAADAAVSRAGSLSISEICTCGAASLLVPYPYAAADHQRKNARFMEEKNAAIYLEDRDCNSATLYSRLSKLLDDPSELKSLQSNAAALAKPDSTQNICERIINLVESS